MSALGRQRLPDGGVASLPPASPDDLEAAVGKYKKRRRRPTRDSIARMARLGVGAACYVAGGVLLGLLVTAAGGRLVSYLAGAPPAARQDAGAQQAHDRRGLMEQLLPGGVVESAGGLSAEVRQALRQEMEGLARSLCDPRPWPGGAPDVAPAEGQEDSVIWGQAVEVKGTAVPRVVDEPFGRQTGANVPGVEDMHAELAAYNSGMLANMTRDTSAAAARQRRTTSAELGLAPLDGLNDTASLPQRIAFLNDLYQQVQAGESLRVCLTATTAADVAAVRRDLLPWMQYHTDLGAAHFYLLYDGQDGEAVRLLGTIRHVTLLHIHAPFASQAELDRFHWYAAGAGEASTRHWLGQPGNFGLMVKQGYGMGEALARAAQDGMHWLMHLDPDELFYPGGAAFSLTAELARQPAHVPAVRFMNYEGQPEAGDLANRLEQVTLFRVHKHFITPEAHFYRQKYKLGDSAAFLMLYANGKSAVRLDAPGVRHLGPHFFTGSPSPRWQTPSNPSGQWLDVVSDDSVVLHYAYSYLADVAAKAHRSCPDDHLEAARRGDRAKVKECFVIDFDADAYMAAARGPEAARDFFFERMVLSEGARVRCADPRNPWPQGWCTLTDIERFKYLMTKLGLYRRIHGPQALLRQHERQIQWRLRGPQAQAGQAGGPTAGGGSARWQ